MMNKELEKRIYSSLVIIPIAFFFIIQGSIFFMFFLSIFFIAISYEWTKMNKKNNLMKILGIIFLFFSTYSTFYVRENLSLSFFIFIILICIFTDIGGYVFGKIFKGPKLTKISPNKTFTGVVGGFLFGLIIGLSYLKYNESKYLDTNFLYVILGILLISLTSQIGDLIISFFKRKSKIKNTGKIIPGHGGILDRIDGMIFAFPYVYILIKIV